MMSFLPRKRRPKGTGPRATKNTGKTLYRCDQCEYETSWPSWLRTHQRVHTGERPFKCHLCTYSSSQSSNLQQHLKRHSDERPYKCDLCEYSCKRGHQLNTHRRTHFPKELLLNLAGSSSLNGIEYGMSLDASYQSVSVADHPTTSAGGETLALAAGAAAAAASSGETGQNSTIDALMIQWKGDLSFKNIPQHDGQFLARVKSDDGSTEDEAESPGRLQIDEPSVS